MQDIYNIEELYNLKLFLNNNGIYEIANSGQTNYSLEFFYNFNTLIINLENIDLFFFFNINLRTNYPILNLRIRKIIFEKENNFFGCYTIGYMNNYSSKIKQITNNIKELLKINEGKH
ncbi:MAG: molybdopterin-dependent oxidoreductase [Candidatus Woesearchaeota archaeon]